MVARTAPRIAAVFRLALVATLLLAAASSRAIIFLATSDPNYNTTAPAGDLDGSGWQWQANFQGYAATPIASNWFLTSKHLPPGLGAEITFNGRKYPTTAVFKDTESDLALWRVCGEFPTFAPLFAMSDETGRPCVFFGYGFTRGPAITVTNGVETRLAGWQWNGNNGRLRWGTNRIEGLANYDGAPDTLLRATFDAEGGAEEATMAGGDSGGGLFVQDGDIWKLAGIGYAVDGPYRYSESSSSLQAALTNQRGLYEPDNGGWALIPFDGPPLPTNLYASRVSARKGWIEQTMADNPPPETVPLVLMATNASGPYQATPAAVDTAARTLRLPRTEGPTFYQLEDCVAWRIASIRLEGDTVVLTYE